MMTNIFRSWIPVLVLGALLAGVAVHNYDKATAPEAAESVRQVDHFAVCVKWLSADQFDPVDCATGAKIGVYFRTDYGWLHATQFGFNGMTWQRSDGATVHFEESP